MFTDNTFNVKFLLNVKPTITIYLIIIIIINNATIKELFFKIEKNLLDNRRMLQYVE